MMRRIGICATVAAGLIAGCSPSERDARNGGGATQSAAAAADPATQAYTAMFTELERDSGGRLGIALVDPQDRVVLAHRADERFALCSTFKLPLAMMLLEEARAGRVDPARTVDYRVAGLPNHSPRLNALANHGQGRISLIDAAQAAVELSDNGAANILLEALGGPAAFTRRLSAWGDAVTRLDRIEPALNENAAGDRRDTTSPAAIAILTGRMARGRILSPADSTTLRSWSRASETGLRRVRAGLPQGVVAGDKTGTCGRPNDSVNDVAWFHGAGEDASRSWSLAVYLDRPTVDSARANAILAEVAAIASRRIGAESAR